MYTRLYTETPNPSISFLPLFLIVFSDGKSMKKSSSAHVLPHLGPPLTHARMQFCPPVARNLWTSLLHPSVLPQGPFCGAEGVFCFVSRSAL